MDLTVTTFYQWPDSYTICPDTPDCNVTGVQQ
jgi:hypothetical protein